MRDLPLLLKAMWRAWRYRNARTHSFDEVLKMFGITREELDMTCDECGRPIGEGEGKLIPVKTAGFEHYDLVHGYHIGE